MTKWRYEYAVPSLGIAGLGTALLLVVAPAFATSTEELSRVEILAKIDTSISLTVNETINIHKFIFLDAVVNVTATKFAEAHASASQANSLSSACENCAERTDTLSGSGNGNKGVTTINQAGGNLNNQAAEVSAAIDTGTPGPGGGPPDPTIGFAEASASATQINSHNSIDVINIVLRDALITDSIHNNQGIVYVNQSVGNINNQTNELALAFSKKGDGVALSEADLGQLNTGAGKEGDSTSQTVSENNVLKTAEIQNGSISHNTGIVGVNQASGNFANQANIVSFAAVQP